MFETDRLILRRLEDADVEEIYRMRSDPDVMRFIRAPQNRLETVNWLKLVSSRWDGEGIGFCALVEKKNSKFLGWCGLWRLKETDEIEIGYAIAKSDWGNGFAAEAARFFLDYAFENLKPERIVAVAEPENLSSRRVMEKLGMKFVGFGDFYNRELVQYVISRKNWLEKRGNKKDL